MCGGIWKPVGSTLWPNDAHSGRHRGGTKILAGIRAQADVIIDTTAMKPADLQEYMGSRFGAVDKKRDMQITVFSFGFKYGIPIDADIVIDVRFLPNPFYVEEYKHWTGRVPEVAAYIENHRLPKNSKENF